METEIRLADGTFTKIQNSVGKEIWTDQQGERKITQIHKFDTAETDPPLFEIGGNWMTGFHFIWEQKNFKWYRACEIPDVKKDIQELSEGIGLRCGTEYRWVPDTPGGHSGSTTFGNCLIVEPHRQGYT